jgi:hypothetical protein
MSHILVFMNDFDNCQLSSTWVLDESVHQTSVVDPKLFFRIRIRIPFSSEWIRIRDPL